jgi:lysophospholipase L1-like esterase
MIRGTLLPSDRHWVAVGDSFSTGIGDYPEAGGWICRTIRRLRADGVQLTLDNHAEPGVPIDAVLAQQVPLLPLRAGVVSAIAGANDLLAYGCDVDELAAHVDAMMAAATACGRLVLTSTCPDFFSHRYGSSRLTARVTALNDAVLRATRTEPDRTLVLDTHRVLQLDAMWHRDGIHPNPLGHRALAELAAQLLRPRFTDARPVAG